ncbi:hypothetical protein [Crenothrix polyspora]|uniref:Uncharacterized protein n=1 Tax=Crenothrix polyspora TaxID=360316 RepID=A0A1R4GYV1_9GAMM|nr:hypothetical protein [Crenothrix polyspora]SJM89148.1 hypothetical protein CRENPOLYSF1_100037 [Crenothrix polyspora]
MAETTEKLGDWASGLISSFIPPVNYLTTVLFERVLPAFANLETEADELVNDNYTWDESVTWYVSTFAVRQVEINLHAVALRHLFEQYLSVLIARWLRERRHIADYSKDKAILKSEGGIDFESFLSWGKLEELRYVCNAIKHAEGSGVKNLYEIRPDLFKHPQIESSIHETLDKAFGRSLVENPMAGDGIYLQEEDIRNYASAIESFWNEFIEKLKN